MSDMPIYQPESSDYDEITAVWESSVRATHTFLSEEDIVFFKPLVRNEYLKACNLYCLKENKEIIAFMGVNQKNLEMLFIRPDKRGKGFGKYLVDYAIKKLGIDKVDVNEQNEQATGFYYQLGFQFISRDEVDGMGKPFPILHLQLVSTKVKEKAFYYETSIGTIGIAEKDGFITQLSFGHFKDDSEFDMEETVLLKEASSQLISYLGGEITSFNLPLAPQGTQFERDCWKALQTIPYGETRTYGQQANLVGNPKASRAVGRANSRNPIAIFIPCHRVIGSNGSLTGFAGGLEIKKQLLTLERMMLMKHGGD